MTPEDDTPTKIYPAEAMQQALAPKSNNQELSERAQDIRTLTAHIMYLLDFYRIPTAEITTDLTNLRQTTDLMDAIEEIELALFVINNTIFTGLDSDSARNTENITQLRKNVGKAIERLTQLSDAIPPTSNVVTELPSPPESDIARIEITSELPKILQEMKLFLRDFIAANHTKLLMHTRATSMHLANTANTLDNLKEASYFEATFEQSYKDHMDRSWKVILCSFQERLAAFEAQIRDVSRPNAEFLILIADREKMNKDLADKAALSEKIQKKAQLKGRITSLPPIELFMQLYYSMTNQEQPNWKAKEQESHEALEDEQAILRKAIGRYNQIAARNSK